jgi:hypothetical protein
MDKNIDPIELLKELLDDTNIEIIDTRSDMFKKIVCGVFIKPIKGDIEVFNDRMRKHSFGPEPIHSIDYKIIQSLLSENTLRRCYYIVYSTDFGRSRLVSIILHDMYYKNWIGKDCS